MRSTKALPATVPSNPKLSIVVAFLVDMPQKDLVDHLQDVDVVISTLGHDKYNTTL
ncbi:hypothetical protein HK097_002096 [Rhizophlyctis rosea]|uniref:Uncharacterized protein n=1 Tax=Rhizophlyctis rosea TaxID=64517 RepID=A0AAD5X0D7_9FUNG|nr:hypothetical protein HK097_002096 [Rhizophlyctis rosea]